MGRGVGVSVRACVRACVHVCVCVCVCVCGFVVVVVVVVVFGWGALFLALMERRLKWREEGEGGEGGIRGINECMCMYMTSEVTLTFFYSVLTLLPDLYTFTSVILNV